MQPKCHQLPLLPVTSVTRPASAPTLQRETREVRLRITLASSILRIVRKCENNTGNAKTKEYLYFVRLLFVYFLFLFEVQDRCATNVTFIWTRQCVTLADRRQSPSCTEFVSHVLGCSSNSVEKIVSALVDYTFSDCLRLL